MRRKLWIALVLLWALSFALGIVFGGCLEVGNTNYIPMVLP